MCSIHVFRSNILYKTLEIDWSKLGSKRIKFESTRKGDKLSPYARVVTESFCDESSLLDEGYLPIYGKKSNKFLIYGTFQSFFLFMLLFFL